MNKKVIKGILIFIVNLITLVRLIGALTLPIIYYYCNTSSVAIYILVLFFTDAIDGFLARKLNVSTFFGCLLDACSDKVLNIIAFVILGFINKDMFCPLVVEISILYTTYSTYRYGGNVSTSKIGKIKTIILDIFVILSFVILSLKAFNINSKIIKFMVRCTPQIISIFCSIILVFCFMTLFDYIKKHKQARNNPNCMNIKYEEKNRKSNKRIIKELFDTNYYQKHKSESIMKQLYLNK